MNGAASVLGEHLSMWLLDILNKSLNHFLNWSETKQDVVLISLAYFLSQGALLFLTGKWIDDWCLFGLDDEALKEIAYMLGHGEPFFWIHKLVQTIPWNGWLTLVFFLYYAAMLSLYAILGTIKSLSRQEQIWLTIFFAVMPINDARVMLCCVHYSFGYSMFFIAFALLALYFTVKNPLIRFLVRIITLVMFALSFIMNSLLFFYAVPLFYIYYKEKRRDFSLLLRYIDFLTIPVAYWILKKTFWPVYGFYAEYNTMNFLSLCKAVLWTLPAATMVLWEIIRHVAQPLLFVVVCTWVLDKAYQCFLIEETSHDNQRRAMLAAWMGLLLVGLGQFPYLVIGRKFHFHIDGFVGRDVILASLGAAVFFFYAIRLLQVHEKLRKVMCFMFVLMSIVSINQRYYKYQQWSYLQMVLQEHMRGSKEIQEGRNFFLVHSENESREWSRHYVLTGIAYEAFGDQKRLFLRPEELHDDWGRPGYETIKHSWFKLADYDFHNLELDGIIYYRHPDELKKVPVVLELKFYELFCAKEFKEKLRSLGYIDYIPAGGFIVNDAGMKTMWSEESFEEFAKKQ